MAAVALLVRGAKPNRQDMQGNTPLHVAAASHNIVGVQLLLASGANPTILNWNGLAPIHYAASSRRFLINDARQSISYYRTAAYAAQMPSVYQAARAVSQDESDLVSIGTYAVH